MKFTCSKLLQLVLGLLGFGTLLIALLCLLPAALGMLGILADVSREENFEMGMTALRIGLIFGLSSLPPLLVLFIIRRMRRRAHERGRHDEARATPPMPPEQSTWKAHQDAARSNTFDQG